MKQLCLSSGIRLIVFHLVLAFAVLIISPHTHATPPFGPNQENIKKIETRLSYEKEKLRILGLQEKDLLAALARLEQEVVDGRGAIRDVSQKIHHMTAEMEMLRRDLALLKQRLKGFQDRIAKRLVEFYKHTRVGYVKAFEDEADLNDLLRRVKYFSSVMAQDRAVLIREAEHAKSDQREISNTEARLNELEEIKKTEEGRLALLKKELEEKVLLLVTIHQEKKFYETAIDELETAAKGLGDTLLDIEKKDRYETNESCHFEDFKGKLPYPMNGDMVKAQGLSASARPGAYKGVFIEGAPGSDVKAIFPGRVAFSGSLKGHGELVIINHGSRFFTVSAHLSTRKKSIGELVKEGEVIGRVDGNNGFNGGRLYFEIRRAGNGLNPQEWLSLQ